jgi:hypothetical protein
VLRRKPEEPLIERDEVVGIITVLFDIRRNTSEILELLKEDDG